MYDVTALGEVLIDFTDYGMSQAGMNIFERNPGGAPANVLAAVSRLGGKSAFIGKIGDDMHGKFLKDTLDNINIDTAGMIMDPEYFTTLAFVTLKNGERSFSFARKPGADTMLRPDEVNQEIIKNSRIFHCGSLSLTDEPSRSASYFAVKKAKNAGCIISYDPNYRPLLWKDEYEGVQMMRSMIPFANLMKLSDEETKLLTGEKNPEKAAGILIEQGVSCVVVTMGKEGSMLMTENVTAWNKGKERKAIDTTGAGDAFWGAFLYKISREGCSLSQLTEEKAQEIMTFANAAAGLCVEKRGAIPAMPTLEQVMKEL